MADIEIYKVVYLPRLRRFICTKRRTDCNVHTVHTSTERVHRASAESSLIGVLSEPLGVIGVFVPHSIPRTTDFLVFIKFYLMFFFFVHYFSRCRSELAPLLGACGSWSVSPHSFRVQLSYRSAAAGLLVFLTKKDE